MFILKDICLYAYVFTLQVDIVLYAFIYLAIGWWFMVLVLNVYSLSKKCGMMDFLICKLEMLIFMCLTLMVIRATT